MTATIPGLEQVRAFVELSRQHPLRSTGAQPESLSSDVYNVVGSTHDPKHVHDHENESWKQLLISFGIPASSNCYVTNSPATKGSSHPDFSVGGHVTTDAGGRVHGGVCYLMPMCSWHNNSARDGIRFTHTSVQMLKLTGYMTGELAATFQLRLPSTEPFAILYYSKVDQRWKFQNVAQNPQENWEQLFDRGTAPEVYVVVERLHDPQTTHNVKFAQLPHPSSE